MLFSGKVTTSVVAELSNSIDLATAELPLAKSYVQSYADGGAVDQAQVMFSDTRSLSSSATESLDLAGALASSIGGAITFTAIKEIIIKAAAANTGNLRVGKVITNGFAGPFDQTAGSLGVTIPPGGILHLRNPSATGWAVTAATGDLLSVENLVAASVSYDIILIGEGSVA